MSELVSPERLAVYDSTVHPIRVGEREFIATTHIGLRPSQEDRFVLVPSFFDSKAAFCGVFDGTVGDHASEFISKNIVATLCSMPAIQDLDDGLFRPRLSGGGAAQAPGADGAGDVPDGVVAAESDQSVDGSGELAQKIREALHNTFLEVDNALIQHCAERGLHYASSTGVVVFLWENLLTVAHVGDSKACIAKRIGEQIYPEWLTVDHKPNMPHELERIERCGGSLVWLHGNKPFIRGGDFLIRQAAGEHPKQLNYSRAFGGKDLKMYGLSAQPDISHFEITAEDKLVIIASDGLWDVLNPRVACEIAFHAQANGRSASNDIVRAALDQMPVVGVRDNITVIVIFLHA